MSIISLNEVLQASGEGTPVGILSRMEVLSQMRKLLSQRCRWSEHEADQLRPTGAKVRNIASFVT
jgi:hypothetical protein